VEQLVFRGEILDITITLPPGDNPIAVNNNNNNNNYYYYYYYYIIQK